MTTYHGLELALHMDWRGTIWIAPALDSMAIATLAMRFRPGHGRSGKGLKHVLITSTPEWVVGQMSLTIVICA
jgi:hypothetical protein